MAAAFRLRYQELKGEGWPPDDFGLGSAKAFECGKFEITNLDITEPKK